MLHVCVLHLVFRKIVEKLFRAQLSALQGFKVYNFTKKSPSLILTRFF